MIGFQRHIYDVISRVYTSRLHLMWILCLQNRARLKVGYQSWSYKLQWNPSMWSLLEPGKKRCFYFRGEFIVGRKKVSWIFKSGSRHWGVPRIILVTSAIDFYRVCSINVSVYISVFHEWRGGSAMHNPLTHPQHFHWHMAAILFKSLS